MDLKRSAESVEDGQQKRHKDTSHPSASRVVHVRGLPQECTAADLVALASNFGPVSDVLLLTGKGQAFIEMPTIAASTQLIQTAEHTPQVVRGSQAYFQFSTRQAITRQPKEVPDKERMENTPPNRVLLVHVQNLVYPITVDVLYQVFSKCGVVQKIVTFNKGLVLGALVQYDKLESAQRALNELNHQNIYSGCCSLRIYYSSLSDIEIKYNNERSRDFTLAAGHPLPPQQGGQGPPNPHAAAGQGGVGSATGPSPPSAHALNMGPTAPGVLVPMGVPGQAYATGAPIGIDPAHAHAVMPAGPVPVATMQPQLQQVGMGIGVPPHVAGHGVGGPVSGVQQVGPMAMVPGMVGGGVGMAPGGPIMAGAGPVVFVTGLDPEKTTCDHLFNLLGVYGDVKRVKILYNKRDQALVQMTTPHQAMLCISNLHDIPMFGRKLSVQVSRVMNVSLPQTHKEGVDTPESHLTKDYSDSQHHRYRKADSKNFQNIVPPSNVLHLSNIAPNLRGDAEGVKELFNPFGNVVQFKFFETGDKHMAILEMESLEEAVHALVERHNHLIGVHNLRVSFSKNKFRARATSHGPDTSRPSEAKPDSA